MSHALPFTEPERINFATTTLIAFSVFHVSIVEQMPHSSDSIPMLAIFIDSLMCLIGLSLVECFLMMNWLSRVGLTVPSPQRWYYVVDRWGDYLWLGASGEYWRRNYLYVFERLNHKLETEMRRRELERRRWAAAKSAIEEQSETIVGAAKKTKHNANLNALLQLIENRSKTRDRGPIHLEIPQQYRYSSRSSIYANGSSVEAPEINTRDFNVVSNRSGYWFEDNTVHSVTDVTEMAKEKFNAKSRQPRNQKECSPSPRRRKRHHQRGHQRRSQPTLLMVDIDGSTQRVPTSSSPSTPILAQGAARSSMEPDCPSLLRMLQDAKARGGSDGSEDRQLDDIHSFIEEIRYRLVFFLSLFLLLCYTKVLFSSLQYSYQQS